MKKIFLLALSFLLVSYSCSRRDDLEPEPEKYVEFSMTVSVDTTGVATKTSMSDNGTVGKITWSSGDYIWLFNDHDVDGIKSYQTIINSDDQTKATFIFQVTENKAKILAGKVNYLFYGNKDLISVTYDDEYGQQFSVSLPANQTHAGTACFNEFENIAFGYVPSGAFKYNEVSGKYEGSAGCAMRNLFGVLKVKVALATGDVSNVRYVRLTDKTQGQYLAGTFDVSIASNGVPTMTHRSKSGGESRTIEKTIPKTCLISSTNPYVYFLVPPGTLFGENGFGLGVYTDSGLYGNKTITPGTSGGSITRSKITQLDLNSFTPNSFPPVTNQNSANSYIFAATAGVASFPAAYKGNGYQGNGGDIAQKSNGITYQPSYYAEIMWQTKCNGDVLLAAEVIDSPVYYNGTNGPCISFHKSGVPGNALIALRDPNTTVSVIQKDGTTKTEDKILWSWHVWITSEKSATDAGVMLTQQSESHGDVITIMDRNLGALYSSPSYGSQFQGLAYQFGRKDPYMGSRYTKTDQTTATQYKSFASIYPGTAIYCIEGDYADDFGINASVYSPFVRSLRKNGAWCSDLVSWGDKSNGDMTATVYKSMYDPCPVGWRTFEEKHIVTALGRDDKGVIQRPNGTVVQSGDGYAFKLTNNGNNIYFPASGYSMTTLAVTEVGGVVALWGSNYSSTISGQSTHTQANYLHVALSGEGTNYTSHVGAMNMNATMAVRCQKWTEPNVSNGTSTPAPSLVKSAECQEEEELEVVYID